MARLQRWEQLPGLYRPTGPWALAVALDGVVFVSGIRGIDPATGRPAPGERARIRQLFENLRRVLEAAGSGCDRVLATRVYVTDMARHRPLVNEMYEEYFGGNLPTRTIVQVSALNQDDIVEVEALALRGDPP